MLAKTIFWKLLLALGYKAAVILPVWFDNSSTWSTSKIKNPYQAYVMRVFEKFNATGFRFPSCSYSMVILFEEGSVHRMPIAFYQCLLYPLHLKLHQYKVQPGAANVFQ
jgi:hypothetical protein